MDGEWCLRMELTLDNDERVVMNGVAVDLTPRGVAAVRTVLRGNWDQLRPGALAMVRKHFESDPSDIPGPGDVNQALFVSTGRAWERKPS